MRSRASMVDSKPMNPYKQALFPVTMYLVFLAVGSFEAIRNTAPPKPVVKYNPIV